MQNDILHPFIFEHTAIRGNTVHLADTLSNALQHQDLPITLKQVLSELMVASALLSATLKMEGTMVLQLQSQGALKLLVVECTSQLEMRATAKAEGELKGDKLTDWINDGQLIITLMPKDSEPYQGIVPLEGDSIAVMLENYMLRSQQIDTRIWLQCTEDKAAGLLLQKLPEQTEHDADHWNRVQVLANTVTGDELLNLENTTLLQRLFAEEEIRLFDGRAIQAFCSCSSEKVNNMIKMLGIEEVQSILDEQGSIQIHCDFCNKAYVLDEDDAQGLFDEAKFADENTAIKH